MSNDVIDQVRLIAPPAKVSEMGRAEQRSKLALAIAAEAPLAEVGWSPFRSRRWRASGGSSHRRAYFIGVAVVVVVAGVAGAILATGPVAPRPKPVANSSHDRRDSSRPATPAQLLAKVTAALDGQSGEVFHVHTVSGNGFSYDTWLTPGGETERFTSYDHGALDNDLTSTVSGNEQSATVVDHPDHAWWSYTEKMPPSSSPNCKLPKCGEVANGGLPPGPDIDGVPGSTAGVKWLLTSGHFTVAPGTEVVDGIETYKLTRTLEPGTRSIWISRATDLPVQLQSTGSANPGNNSLSTVSWLPSTTANLAKLQVHVPSGFIHSPHPL